jgi:hypothetical protein
MGTAVVAPRGPDPVREPAPDGPADAPAPVSTAGASSSPATSNGHGGDVSAVLPTIAGVAAMVLLGMVMGRRRAVPSPRALLLAVPG